MKLNIFINAKTNRITVTQFHDALVPPFCRVSPANIKKFDIQIIMSHDCSKKMEKRKQNGESIADFPNQR